jgi:hypothetical protein
MFCELVMQSKRTHVDYVDDPVVWFVILEQARRKSDHEKMSQARQELMRLGVDVRYENAAKIPLGETKVAV